MNAVIKFHPLTYLDEGDDVVVGRRDVDSYIALPREGADLLRRLTNGDTPAEAARWYKLSYGQDVDIEDFLAAVTDAGFVRPASQDHPVSSETAPPVRWRKLATAMFSPPAWFCYTALVGAAVLACLDEPSLLPRHSDVFFTSSLVVIEVTLMVLTLPFTLLHEVFHVMAGRRLGLRSRVRLSNRFYFLVFETVMDGLVSVPRRQRYLPMLAGLLADTLALASFIGGAWLLRGPMSDLTGAVPLSNLLMAMAFTTLPRMGWQGYFFLRTDGYYLIATITGCDNLHEAGWWRLRTGLSRLTRGRLGGTVTDGSQFGATDLRVSRWYAPLLLVGYGLACGVLIFVVLPLAWAFFTLAITRVFTGAAQNTAQLWDAAVVLTVTLGQVVLAAVLAIRQHRSTKQRTLLDQTPRR